MKSISMADGGAFTVDDDDYETATRWKWKCERAGGCRYLRRSYSIPPWNQRKKKWVYLHRVLMGDPDGMDVDHIDGNPLNCQRGNLRVATRSQNAINSRKAVGVSGFRGAWPKRGRFQATITLNDKQIYCGTFDTPEEAHASYLDAARVLHGEFNPLVR